MLSGDYIKLTLLKIYYIINRIYHLRQNNIYR